MVESAQTVEAAEAIRSLYAAGAEEREIHELVSAVAIQSKPDQDQAIVENGLMVYEVLPEGLISLPEAAKKYDRSIGTLHSWRRQGRIEAVGRLRASAPGGGYYLFRISDIKAVNAATRRRKR